VAIVLADCAASCTGHTTPSDAEAGERVKPLTLDRRGLRLAAGGSWLRSARTARRFLPV